MSLKFILQQIFSIVGITQLITVVIVCFSPQNLDHLQWSNNNRRRCKIQITMRKIIKMVCVFMLVWLQLHSTCTADPARSQSLVLCSSAHPEEQKKELVSLCPLVTVDMDTARSSEASWRCKIQLPLWPSSVLTDSSEDCSTGGNVPPESPRPVLPCWRRSLRFVNSLHCH